MAESGKVEISRNTLTGLVVALTGTVLVLVFVAGRMSASPAPSVATAPPPVAVPVATPLAGIESSNAQTLQTEPVASPPPPLPPATAEPPVSSEPPAPAPITTSATVATVPQQPTAASVPAGHNPAPPHRSHDQSAQFHSEPSRSATASNNGAAVDPSLKLAVTQYFLQIDQVMAGTGDLGDMNGFATSLLNQGAQGDSSGFDDLIHKTQAAEAKLRDIHPPVPCKEHYAMATSQLHSMLALLQSVKKATMTMDTGAFSALSAQGQQMQSQVNRLQELGAQLKHRYSN